MIIAEIAINDRFLSSLAWVFTFLSGTLSIILSIHRFGLSPKKRIAAIAGLLSFGIILVVLLVSDVYPFNRLVFITSAQSEQLRRAHERDGNQSSGFTVTDTGVIERPANGEVNRVSTHIYAVIHPNGSIKAVYNGGFFDAEIKGRTVNCELIDIGNDRVLIIMGSEIETHELLTKQEENIFRIQKVPVPKPSGS